MGVYGSDFEVSSSPVAPALLKLAARKAVNDASRKSRTARELAANARDNMERALGLGWHVVVGTDFSVELRYRKGACVLLSSKGVNMKVLLFRSTPAATPAPTSEHDALVDSDREAGEAKRKVTVYESDMPDEMKDAVLHRAKRLVSVYDGEDDPQTKIAQALKHSLTRAYGHTWQVIVAAPRDFCCLPHVDAGSHADFAVSKLRVVVYRHAGASLDRRLDMAQSAKRAAFVLATICVVVFAFFFFTATDAQERCLPKGEGEEPENCSVEDVDAAKSNAFGKKVAMIGMTAFTVLASIIRTYLNTIRPKYKQA